MARPQINKINPFDANYDHNISFTWIGFQAYSNRIIIYKNSTLETVYDSTIESMMLIHKIPNNTLQNGETYIIQCQVFDSYGNESELSNKFYFKTYTTPQFIFDGIEDKQIITTSSCSVNAIYFQLESEPLSYYRFAIYDSYKNLISQTDDIYNSENISHIYKGLNTETTYFIRCYGVTLNGISVDTGYVEIYVNYGVKHNYARIYVEQDKRTSGITYRTNINVVVPDGDEEYEYEDDKIVLLDKTIVYKDGFTVNDDFTLKLKGNYLYRIGDILILKNEDCDVTVSAYIYYDETMRCKLSAPNGVCSYIIYSDPLVCTNEDDITIAIRREKGLYDIKIFKE